MKTNDTSKIRNPMRPQCKEWVPSLEFPLATSMIERLLYADVERNANNLLLDVMDKHFFRATTKSACNNTKKFNIELVACRTIEDFVLSNSDFFES